MAYRRTKYEITALEMSPNGGCYLIAYSGQRSRAGLLIAMRKFGDELVEKLGVTDDHKITWAGGLRSSATLAGWIISFTGRTQKEAQREGELPWIAA